MSAARQLLRERGPEALWDRCLGFLDWTTERMAREQSRALLAQLAAVQASPLARQLLGERPIETVEQFRETAPLTDYETYSDTLGARREEVLTEPPAMWLRTSGRADGSAKWVPLSTAGRTELGWITLGLFIAALARERGDVRLGRDLRLLNMTAPPPYMSGTAVATFHDLDLWPARLYPSNDPGLDALSFDERMAVGFNAAARRGVDIALSYSSVLAGVGSALARGNLPIDSRGSLRDPAGLARLWRARLGPLRERRGALPRDLWRPRAIIAGGMDAALFRGSIIEQWGCDPLELLGSTEGLFLGVQTWDRTTTTLIPHFNFFEFIPQHDLVEEEAHPGHTPSPRLLTELEVGGVYELVVTNLLGGALMRCRTGELVSLSAVENAAAGVALPQFTYRGQRTDLVEVAGFARLSEMALTTALRRAEVPALEWTARKEVEQGQPIVHLRLELAQHDLDVGELTTRLDAALRQVDPDWADMEDIAGLRPLRLTQLPAGTLRLAAESAAVPGGSVPRINASDAAIELVMSAARSPSGSGLRE